MDSLPGLSMPASEIVLRGTSIFLALALLLRIVPKRNAGHISPNDMLVLILIGAMGADAIVGDTTSRSDILLMIAVVLAWSYLQDLLEFRVPAFRRLMRHPSTALVQDGRILRRNMRREMVTDEELMTVLRKQGIDDLAGVQSACMEADGEISVIKKERR